LKLVGVIFIKSAFVAPRAGAWIETNIGGKIGIEARRAPRGRVD